MTINWTRISLLSAIGLIGLMLIWLLVSWAAGPIIASVERANYDAELVRHYNMLIAEKPAYERALGNGGTSAAEQAAIYHDSSAELASAQLQNTVQGLVVQAGGQLQSSALGVPQVAHGLQVLTVTLSLSLPSDRLAGFLTAVETIQPYLIVKDIDIRSADMGVGAEPLDIQLQISGFSQIE